MKTRVIALAFTLVSTSFVLLGAAGAIASEGGVAFLRAAAIGGLGCLVFAPISALAPEKSRA